MRICFKQGMLVAVLAVVLFYLLGTPLGYTLTIYEPSITIIWDGSQIQPISLGEAVPIPAGSKIDVINWPGEAHGYTVVAISTPDDTGPGGGAVPGLNANKPRITSPNGTTFEIPNPEDITEVTETDGIVRVTYADGSSAELPGKYLPPGTPNPLTSMENNGILGAEGIGDMLPGDAYDFFSDFVSQPWAMAIFGGPISLDDFNYDFLGDDPFPLGEGFLYIDYPTNGRDKFGVSIPEPSTLFLLGSLILVIFGSTKKMTI